MSIASIMLQSIGHQGMRSSIQVKVPTFSSYHHQHRLLSCTCSYQQKQGGGEYNPVAEELRQQFGVEPMEIDSAAASSSSGLTQAPPEDNNAKSGIESSHYESLLQHQLQQQQQQQQHQSAAAFILSQALLEEQELEAEEARTGIRKTKEVNLPELREKGWDGDEPQYRAIQRILADTYKPLRVPGYKKKIPIPAPLPNRLFDSSSPSAPILSPAPSSPLVGDGVPLPMQSITGEEKPPWAYSFKAPDNYQPAIKQGFQLPGLRHNLLSRSTGRRDRLAKALEKSLDFKAGYDHSGHNQPRIMVPDEQHGETIATGDGGGGGGGGGRTSMGNMRNWNGFVEDKIEQARRDGLFKNVKGRGKPIPRDEAESNPFIPREEFLINRIVQTQGAAPPWVELQGELDNALTTFRNELRLAWVRRATRMNTVEGVTPSAIRAIREGWRDPEWESRERAYHETAVKHLNSIIRRYNVIAPYSVRRPLVFLSVELEKCFSDSVAHIQAELQRRLDGHRATPLPEREKRERERKGRTVSKEEEQRLVQESMWQAFKRVFVELLGTQPDQPVVRQQHQHH